MSTPTTPADARSLADAMAARRGRRYPAHAYLAEHFPDYVEMLLHMDYVVRQKPRLFDERMHELFHIVALAVEMSNPVNQPHLRQHLKKGLRLGLKPEEIAEALMVCVNPCGTKVLTYGVTCMLEAMEEIRQEDAASGKGDAAG
ncbi:MAG: carboxymuconolactone decarboxylase family protein [bacterium]|jgi:alkylhydroperoxidase/carboxymuconolactone decarboxylase family protein YurZ|nr:carboxymuconolactone decarboxylase family protein [Betaproteobacteria bacterium]